jgi:hypothetical protein
MFAYFTAARRAHTTAQTITVSDSLSGTWTQVALSSGTHTFGSSYNFYYALYQRTTPATTAASAITVTVDLWATTDTGDYALRVFTVPGTATVVQSITSSTATTSQSVTITLSGTPSASNCTIACFGGNVDNFTTMASISTWTTLMNTASSGYAVAGIFYKDGNTSTGVTQSSVGTSQGGSIGGVVFEVSVASATVADNTQFRRFRRNRALNFRGYR